MTNILVVEDNAGLRRLIGIHLRRAGYEVSEAADGQAALDLLEHSRVHLIITDVMMPRLDGYGLIRELREAGDTTPVLMVTVKNSFDDMRTGFHAGADDYLTKPVNFEELLLRVGALLRRCGIQHSGEIAVGGCTLHADTLLVTGEGCSYELRPREFALLQTLLAAPMKIFTRQMLIDTQPKDFNTLVRLSGFSHGTDVWLGNARELIVSGTASVLETVGCRDDIMLYLISMGLDPKMSFKIMEAVRKGKVKKGGFQDGWVEAMQEHDVPEWYIESLAKIGYLFPKAHAVAYVMMAFRIAWFKVHEPLAFYATFFSIRAKAFDAAECCKDADALRRRIREIENNKDATAVEQDLMTTLEVCYEFCLRGFHFEPIDIYRSDATKFVVTENGLLPPFTSVRGLGETAALDTVEKRKGKDFTSVEEFSLCCNKLSQTHIDQLRALGAFAGLPETSQLTLF